jgi:lysophospholipid acyltransferase (LPLAT)-like uncharacterized protein
VWVLFTVLRWTWRLEEGEYPEGVKARLKSGEPVVFGHYHEDEWAMLAFYAYRGMNVLVSLSKDGSLMERFLSKLGFRIARGSSSRGGVSGLLGLIRSVKEASPPRIASLAIDGPRGPRRRVKKGIFKLAESLRAPVVAGAAAADRAWVFEKSWSKAFIPKPFARVRVRYESEIPVDLIEKNVERDDFAELSFALEEKLKSAKSLAKMNSGRL